MNYQLLNDLSSLSILVVIVVVFPSGLIWFNIKDLRALAPLGEVLKLHAVTLSHFYDLRLFYISMFLLIIITLLEDIQL